MRQTQTYLIGYEKRFSLILNSGDGKGRQRRRIFTRVRKKDGEKDPSTVSMCLLPTRVLFVQSRFFISFFFLTTGFSYVSKCLYYMEDIFRIDESLRTKIPYGGTLLKKKGSPTLCISGDFKRQWEGDEKYRGVQAQSKVGRFGPTVETKFMVKYGLF